MPRFARALLLVTLTQVCLAGAAADTPAETRDGRALAEREAQRLMNAGLPFAEKMLRECVELREEIAPDNWTTFDAKSMLGEALLGQKKHDEARPLLLAGYEGMKQRMASIPPEGVFRLTDTIDRLIQLYQALDQPDEVAKWKTELDNSRKKDG